MDDYTQVEGRFFTFVLPKRARDPRAISYAKRSMDEKIFKHLLNQLRDEFPLEKQLACQINQLTLSDTDKENMFSNLIDPITQEFISIPILYVTEQPRGQYKELWDFTAYLDYLIADLNDSSLHENLGLKTPSARLQDDITWQTDDSKWQLLVNSLAQSAHRLKNPKTLQMISYKNLKVPSEADLREIHESFAKIKTIEPTRPSQ